MNIRVEREKLEEKIYFPFASFSANSRGRRLEEPKCALRTDYQRDRDRIIHSKAFRRLKHKTQVFISPEGDHFRTRLTHTLEVCQIARTIARALRLNEDLAEAIALGHDLGHTPFGHSGENVLDELKPGFKHARQSLKIVDLLENKKKNFGINLTWEVRDGILNHTGKDEAGTLEGKIIKFADRIAYINHDIDDAIRAGIISDNSLPKEIIKTLGRSHSKRISTMINSIIKMSYSVPDIIMEPQIYEAMMELRSFMFKNVYLDSTVKAEEKRIKNLLVQLYNHYIDNFFEIPLKHMQIYSEIEHTKEEVVIDFIAGMTDNFAIEKCKELFLPRGWSAGGCHVFFDK